MPSTLLEQYLKKGDLDKIKELVKNGVNIHCRSYFAIRWSARVGHLEIVKYLVETGSDIHVDNDGPLRSSVKYGHLEIVKYLVEKGANIHAENNYALFSAISNNHLEIVKFLVENGANINSNNYGALQCAAIYEHIDIVKYLIEKGANIHMLRPETIIRLGLYIFDWGKKPEEITFRKYNECPISREDLNDSIPQLGCSQCLNLFKKEALEEWLKTSFECPLCKNDKFYLINSDH